MSGPLLMGLERDERGWYAVDYGPYPSRGEVGRTYLTLPVAEVVRLDELARADHRRMVEGIAAMPRQYEWREAKKKGLAT